MNYPTLRLFKERLWRWLIKNERNLRKIEKGVCKQRMVEPSFSIRFSGSRPFHREPPRPTWRAYMLEMIMIIAHV